MNTIAKKALLLLVLACVASGGVFALTVGGGGYITSDSGGGVEGSSGGYWISEEMPHMGFGAFVFLDVTFAELSVGFAHGSGDYKMESNIGSPVGTKGFAVNALDFGLMLKYPILLGQRIMVFPMAGAVYHKVLSAKIDGLDVDSRGLSAGDFSAVWFRGGLGLDYALTEVLFLRAEGLYGIRLKNRYEKDGQGPAATYGDVKYKLTHGFDVKLAVGVMF